MICFDKIDNKKMKTHEFDCLLSYSNKKFNINNKN